MKVTRDEARAWFAHPTQLRASKLASADDLPDEGFEYWADGPICGVFHRMPWPDVWMVHYGVKPEGWGRLVEPAKRVLRAFAAEHRPARVIGWTEASNRAAVAFTRRCGFTEDGRMMLPTGEIVMTGWRPECR